MELTFKGVQYKSLAEMTRKNPQDDEFCSALQETGKNILDNAVDVFFKPDREIYEAKKAVEDMKDLEFAMKSCYENARKNQDEAINATKDEMKKPESFKYDLGKVEIHPYGIDYFDYKGRILASSNQKIVCSSDLDQDDLRDKALNGIGSFINDLHTVLPLYTCVAMVPGPMSLSVKNFAKEILEGSINDKSRAQSSSQSQGLKGSLLLLGGAVNAASSESYSQNDVEGKLSYQKTTTDERVMPALMDLRSRLDEMKMKETLDYTLITRYDIKGEVVLKGTFGKKGPYCGGAHKDVKSNIKTEHIWLPETGSSSFFKKTAD